jgi:hypothetical protein
VSYVRAARWKDRFGLVPALELTLVSPRIAAGIARTRAPMHGVAVRRALPNSTPNGASHPTDDKYSDVNVDTMNVFMGSYDASLAMSNL